MELKAKIDALKEEALAKIKASENLDSLNQVRVAYLGKKGPLTEVLRGMKDLSAEERPKIGALANVVRDEITTMLEEKKALLEMEKINQALAAETVDVTLPGNHVGVGQPHVLTQIIEEIEDLFIGMGYSIIEGPEVEEDRYNFEMMNLPKDHPARDMQDTFYITEEVLLRTHTSPVQARTMEKHDFSKGPLRMISPGRVYRRDSDDATHSHQFHQIEGLVVDEQITMGDLKGTLELFAKHLFGAEREIRLRPSYFPFTEPSVEVDVSCFKCGGAGCNVCKHTGWIEILGAGIVHPNVLEMAGIDAAKYSGFAFGLGPDRVAMLKYGIDDIRHFYQNDVRFLNQFKVKE
ncbi:MULTISPECIES: phenylalanine--tRNA ligase subunit alpha [Carnobacterium]|jgi:phenylalanyl-tRNA synthetase alpha chain|uniref:Phenylalanine--tRNA ligase alpha subunit n=2 Tax=Carnobacterium maltaromaticum TaxID=2751 RepID=A0AAW9K7Y8_CARML|nr:MULTISPECIES: phenylalanine--tRNA ligase subunit alpha [Carnobacterium]AOA02442.1 phenylalanine--tRNA ligase subunit alpha [Carnobacterium maltaromaticum]MBC9789211.1 phenylalanine--tRNA ligase subunit alpha [Carnobacterium maltaromaticum]MBQ6483764.1 phenylalanine--tRNA ligase subunit alpha [Carnobacterium sp.]MCI1819375.1 phenylalanine--tRNA ligase subunit alpha [Carnobacterium maltaromaticum]MDW5522837.1 phenylalanine--tRNA ligase subunit alpha [Carnobacterium maltaromaticum]